LGGEGVRLGEGKCQSGYSWHLSAEKKFYPKRKDSSYFRGSKTKIIAEDIKFHKLKL
jgi:hypothetical protein